MAVQFLLFVMTILLLLIFWELSKINSRIKKTCPPATVAQDTARPKES
jgi:competence protein ComGC